MKAAVLDGELTAFAKGNGLSAAHCSAIGAFRDVTLGYFDRERRDYKRILLAEQVEVLSLLGDIALDRNEPKVLLTSWSANPTGLPTVATSSKLTSGRHWS